MDLTRRRFLAAAPVAFTGTLGAGSLLAALEAHSAPLPDLSSWDAVRGQFALDPAWAHFASFFIASHPTPVRDAIEAWRRAMDRDPFQVIEAGMFEEESKNVPLKVQAAIAKYIGGRAEDVALTRSTTEGLALIYHGLPLRAGDEVVVTTHDHYSHHESIRLASERSGATTRRIKLYDDAKDATRRQPRVEPARGHRSEDARGRIDVGAFEHRHAPADPRDGEGVESQTSRRAARDGRRARHRRGGRNDRHDGARLHRRGHAQVDVRAARHGPVVVERRRLGAPAPDGAELHRLGVVQRMGRRTAAERADRRRAHRARRLPCLRASVGDVGGLRDARSDGSRARGQSHHRTQHAHQAAVGRAREDPRAYAAIARTCRRDWWRSRSTG